MKAPRLALIMAATLFLTVATSVYKTTPTVTPEGAGTQSPAAVGTPTATPGTEATPTVTPPASDPAATAAATANAVQPAPMERTAPAAADMQEPPRLSLRTDIASRGSVEDLRPLSTGRPTLRMGDSGAAVEALQSRLRVKHQYPLALTGTFDAATDRYVREFQSHMGLGADGVVGPATWEALVNHFQELEWSGPGFYRYIVLPDDASWGTEKSISLIHQVAAQWAARGHVVRIGVNDISKPHGGYFPPHSSHRNGREVDMRIFRNDGIEEGLTWQDPAYSRALTQELVDLLYATGEVETILFNDPHVRGVKPWPGHDDHLHIRFRP